MYWWDKKNGLKGFFLAKNMSDYNGIDNQEEKDE